MRAKTWLVLLLFGLMASRVNAAQFEQKIQLDAVWTNYGKLFDFVAKARAFALKVNGIEKESNVAKYDHKDILKIGDGNQTVTVEFSLDVGPETLDGRNMPARSTTVRYEFARPKDAIISEIEISFGEYRHNEIKIKGSDQAQVDAAFAMLTRAIQPETTAFGNLGFRFLLGIVIAAIALVFLLIAINPEVPVRGRTRLALLVGAVILASVIFSGRVERTLPECSISDSQGWLNENNALFTFLSLILGIAIPILDRLWDRSSNPKSGESASSKAPQAPTNSSV